jgi:hypothetical protein
VLVAVDAAALHAQRHGSGGAAPQREAREAAGAAGGSGGGGPSVPPESSKAQAQPAASAWPTMPQVSLHMQGLQAKVPSKVERRTQLETGNTSAGIIQVHHTSSLRNTARCCESC